MGCLNDTGVFPHWFGNIHLSGPCNRSCYFCIGQHMMALDPENNLDLWPLRGLQDFLMECNCQRVTTVFVTGTNTDPLLFKHTPELRRAVVDGFKFRFGIRTNGIAAESYPDRWRAYDCGSLTICSLDPVINERMMGGPAPRALSWLLGDGRDIKINIVLGPENRRDVFRTLDLLTEFGPRRVNLREPYGQPHQGDPLARMKETPCKERYGMPIYAWGPLDVCYWDVHYVEDLYATGRVSLTYPITKGHDPSGEVHEQSRFPGGRVRAQWLPKQSVMYAESGGR